jgi:hypothetical protein
LNSEPGVLSTGIRIPVLTFTKTKRVNPDSDWG